MMLRTQVTIQQQTITTTDNYAQVPSWSTYAASVYANIVETGGVEYWRGAKMNADTSHVVTVRYETGLTASANRKMRVIYGSRTLYVTSVIADERKRWLTMQCREEV